jgi:large subunit ribosomal protein L30
MITEPQQMRKIIKALGLGRINSTKVHKDNNCIRGMINKVKHLVNYELSSK